MSLLNVAAGSAMANANTALALSRASVLKPSTVRAYEKDLRHYSEGFGGGLPCDVATLSNYIAWLGKRVGPTTTHRRLMALRYEHLRRGYASPTDVPSMRSVVGQLKVGVLPMVEAAISLEKREPRQAEPLSRELLRRMLRPMGKNLLDRRDRCLFLLGFDAMLSRSSLVALDISDIRFCEHEMHVAVREVRADGEVTRFVTVHMRSDELCAVRATKEWIADMAPHAADGPLFRRFDRGGRVTAERLDAAWVSVVLKTRLSAVGVDSKNFSGQSLRRGRLTELKGGAA